MTTFLKIIFHMLDFVMHYKWWATKKHKW